MFNYDHQFDFSFYVPKEYIPHPTTFTFQTIEKVSHNVSDGDFERVSMQGEVN